MAAKTKSGINDPHHLLPSLVPAERLARNCLLLRGERITLRPVEDLEELTHARAHAHVHVRLGALQVVQQ